jgi:hypothetical protein
MRVAALSKVMLRPRPSVKVAGVGDTAAVAAWVAAGVAAGLQALRTAANTSNKLKTEFVFFIL